MKDTHIKYNTIIHIINVFGSVYRNVDFVIILSNRGRNSSHLDIQLSVARILIYNETIQDTLV